MGDSMLATCVSGRGRLVRHALVAGVLITACLSSACGGGTSEEAPKPATSVKNPVDPATAGRIGGKVTLIGTPPAPETIKTTSDPYCTATITKKLAEDSARRECCLTVRQNGVPDVSFDQAAAQNELRRLMMSDAFGAGASTS